MPHRPCTSQNASSIERQSCHLQTSQQQHCTDTDFFLDGQLELPYLRNWCNENYDVQDRIDNACYEQEKGLVKTSSLCGGTELIPEVVQRSADSDITDSDSKCLTDNNTHKGIQPQSQRCVLKSKDAAIEKNDRNLRGRHSKCPCESVGKNYLDRQGWISSGSLDRTFVRNFHTLEP